MFDNYELELINIKLNSMSDKEIHKLIERIKQDPNLVKEMIRVYHLIKG